jgi:acyl phosphate:glycerol-3-phosphate acyltransferase
MTGNLFAQISHAFPYWVVIASYFIGSIPTSFLVGKLFFHTDIRQSGSGNTGATNALRTFGVPAGIGVLLIDVLKGVAVVFLAKAMNNYVSSLNMLNWIIALSGLSVILGHVFTVFLRFKGGKGVATAGGVFFALVPLPMLFCLVFFGIVVYITKYVSVGSMLAAGAFLFIEIMTQVIMKFNNVPRLMLVCLVVVLILARHRANLRRLMEGNENKISFRTHFRDK